MSSADDIVFKLKCISSQDSRVYLGHYSQEITGNNSNYTQPKALTKDFPPKIQLYKYKSGAYIVVTALGSILVSWCYIIKEVLCSASEEMCSRCTNSDAIYF